MPEPVPSSNPDTSNAPDFTVPDFSLDASSGDYSSGDYSSFSAGAPTTTPLPVEDHRTSSVETTSVETTSVETTSVETTSVEATAFEAPVSGSEWADVSQRDKVRIDMPPAPQTNGEQATSEQMAETTALATPWNGEATVASESMPEPSESMPEPSESFAPEATALPAWTMHPARAEEPEAEAEAEAEEPSWFWALGSDLSGGPATSQQIRDWLSEGRLHAGALVWREGMPGWAPLNSTSLGVPSGHTGANASVGETKPSWASQSTPVVESISVVEPISVADRLVPASNSNALIGYYLSVFALIPCIGAFLGPAAFVLGWRGLSDYNRNPEIRGRTHALVAIVLGGVCSLVWWAVLPSLLRP